MMDRTKTLSLVVPVYGTDELVRRTALDLEALATCARRCGFELIEAILVDDASPSPASVPSGFTCLRNETNLGKGASVRRGALAAKGEWVLMSDADESVPFAEFPRLAAASEAWIVCGSRCGREGMPLVRRILSRLFETSVRLFAPCGVRDTQCGFKLFRMEPMRAIFAAQCVDRFAFDVELIRRVRAAGGSVAEVAVRWHGNRRSTLRVMRDAPRMLLDLLRIRSLTGIRPPSVPRQGAKEVKS